MIELKINQQIVENKIHFKNDMDDTLKIFEFVIAFHTLVNSLASMTGKSYDTAKLQLLMIASGTEKDFLSANKKTEKKEP